VDQGDHSPLPTRLKRRERVSCGRKRLVKMNSDAAREPTRSRSDARQRGRILIVDDDPDLRSFVVRVLEAEGYRADEAATSAEATAAIDAGRPDLVILDVTLGSEDGFDVLATLRRKSELPVILLTARGKEIDRVLGLKLGADDYVVKPFSPAELAARVGTVLRRATGPQRPSAPPLEFEGLEIDPSAHEVRVSGTLVRTTAKEFALLTFLARSPRQVFTRGQLLTQVWDSSAEWQDADTVTEYVRRVRKKIEADPNRPRWIQTVRGVGYRFEP
jgi:DNA-binding response OmpR family regulator